jgi:hypothetical protein
MGAMNDDEPESQNRAPDREEIDDETLVYDVSRHTASCLNEFAARVWRDVPSNPNDIRQSQHRAA